MFTSTTNVRVRYGETDRMGYVYYGNYATYLEVARVEALRSLGCSYREMEEGGIMMPVLESNVQYLKPAFYDELLSIFTMVPEMPAARIHFEYEIFNESRILIAKAYTTLAFINRQTGKPCRIPPELKKSLSAFFEG